MDATKGNIKILKKETKTQITACNTITTLFKIMYFQMHKHI